MLFITDRKTVVVADGDGQEQMRGENLPLSAACGFLDKSVLSFEAGFGAFAYYFGQAGHASCDPRGSDALDDLASVMESDACTVPSEIPPVFSFFAQFIENDISAPVDMVAGLSDIDVPVLEPLGRNAVTRGAKNLRRGKLCLDAVYGETAVRGPIAESFRAALRRPDTPAKLSIGTLQPSAFGTIPIPAASDDTQRDLPRLAQVADDPDTVLGRSLFAGLPAPLRSVFEASDQRWRPQRAMIGDLRNDASLPLAQFHLVWLRLHNRFVDHRKKEQPGSSDAEAFLWAQQQLRWHYQWLVINAFLPAICDRAALSAVMKRGPVLYQQLARAARDVPHMPLPLEFCAAAFQIGTISMRESYDWNRFYGRGTGTGPRHDASLDLLFRMTGNADVPMTPSEEIPSALSLPAHWPIEWDRFVFPVARAGADRSARRIGPHFARQARLAPHPAILQGSPMSGRARGDLRRGLRLNLPCAQDCIAMINQRHGIGLAQLTPGQLGSGATRYAVQDAHFDDYTPLWFYILKEAEILGRGGRLGPFGTLLVADTLLGLIAMDRDSYWHQSGQVGRWRPRDGVRIDGVEINSMPALMRAAGLM